MGDGLSIEIQGTTYDLNGVISIPGTSGTTQLIQAHDGKKDVVMKIEHYAARRSQVDGEMRVYSQLWDSKFLPKFLGFEPAHPTLKSKILVYVLDPKIGWKL